MHTWSLAIEEQFYFFWPLLLVLLSRRIRQRSRVALLLFGAAFAAMAYRDVITRWTAHGFDRVNWGTTDTHVDGLLVGCGVAFLVASERSSPGGARRQGWLRTATPASCAVVLVLIAVAGFNRNWTLISYPAVVIATGIVLAGLVAAPSSLLGRGLSARLPVWIGRRSYGLYLYHFIIFNAIPGPHGCTAGPTSSSSR